MCLLMGFTGPQIEEYISKNFEIVYYFFLLAIKFHPFKGQKIKFDPSSIPRCVHLKFS